MVGNGNDRASLCFYITILVSHSLACKSSTASLIFYSTVYLPSLNCHICLSFKSSFLAVCNLLDQDLTLLVWKRT